MIQSQEQHFFPTRRRYVFFGEPGRMPINRNPHIEITHYILLSPRNESGTQSVILPATSVHRFDCEDITSMEPETSSLYIECRLVTGVNGNPMIVFGWLLIPSVVPTVHIISPFNRTCCSHSSGTVWTWPTPNTMIPPCRWNHTHFFSNEGSINRISLSILWIQSFNLIEYGSTTLTTISSIRRDYFFQIRRHRDGSCDRPVPSTSTNQHVWIESMHLTTRNSDLKLHLIVRGPCRCVTTTITTTAAATFFGIIIIIIIVVCCYCCCCCGTITVFRIIPGTCSSH